MVRERPEVSKAGGARGGDKGMDGNLEGENEEGKAG